MIVCVHKIFVGIFIGLQSSSRKPSEANEI